MFAPSQLSGRLTERCGAFATARLSGVLLVGACALAALPAGSALLLDLGLVLVGVGWNFGLMAGSSLLTSEVPSSARPRREGIGEVATGAAAAIGGVGSGVLSAAGGYSALALAALVVAVPLLFTISGQQQFARS
jgi:predicted MFS family arabinose efflux permease